MEEDDAENLLNAMEERLLRRRFGPPIRREISDETSPFLSQLLADQLRVSADEGVPPASTTRSMRPCSSEQRHRPSGLEVPFVRADHQSSGAEVESSRAQDIFAAIRERDILLHHPYSSFSTSVQAFLGRLRRIEGARHQADVVPYVSNSRSSTRSSTRRMRQSRCWRWGRKSRHASDEAANIAWARKLERAGVHVVLRHRGPEDPLQS